MQRRLMPSLSELVAFEAVARLSSITAAAEELALTQGALSKQIRQLEATLGLELFERGHRHVRITPNGEAYVDEIRPILKRLERATHGVISANRKVETLALGVLPAFSSCWLAPRLAGFAAENPTVTVHCHTYLQPFDFEKETFDAAIHIGHDNWSGTRAYRLFGEDIVAVASPEYCRLQRLRAPSDIARATLIHNSARPALWPIWLSSHHLRDEVPCPRYSFDHFADSAAAAASGLGIALVPRFAVADQLRRGQLITPFDEAIRGMDEYFLVVPARKAGDATVARFRKWLLAEARLESGERIESASETRPSIAHKNLEYS